jgi:pteridine reductase
MVTGGGRRLGRAIAEALAEAGCSLVIHYGRSRQAAEATVEALRAEGVEAECLGADLADASQIDQLFRRVESSFGRLDILVNSAATFEKAPITEITAADWDRVQEVNLKAPFLCIRHAESLMRGTPRSGNAPGAVINIGDLSGVLPWPGYAHHGVSKAGLLHLTRLASRELAPEIRVNAVVPGPVLPPPGVDEENEDWRSLTERIPAARPGSPGEVGAAVVFLATNDFIYGETIYVDGGEHLLGAGHRQM